LFFFISLLKTAKSFTTFFPTKNTKHSTPDFAFQAAFGGRNAGFAGDFGFEAGDAEGAF